MALANSLRVVLGCYSRVHHVLAFSELDDSTSCSVHVCAIAGCGHGAAPLKCASCRAPAKIRGRLHSRLLG